MNGGILAYLIEPEQGTMKSCRIDSASAKCLLELSGHKALDRLRFDENHWLYFDDEGLRDGVTHYLAVDGHPDPLIGSVALVSTEEAAPRIAMQEALSRFRCFRAVMDPVIESTHTIVNNIETYVSSVKSFHPRVEEYSLVVV